MGLRELRLLHREFENHHHCEIRARGHDHVWLIILISVLVIFFIVGVVGFLLLLRGEVKPNTLPFEAAKGLLQLALVSAGGSALALLSSDYQRRRENVDRRLEKKREDKQRRLEKERDDAQRRREFRQEQIQAVLAQATASYNDVKRARRLLRVAEHIHLAENYDKSLAEINDAQLEFETLKDVVGSIKPVFSDSAKLVAQLDIIEKYSGRHAHRRMGEQAERIRRYTRAAH